MPAFTLRSFPPLCRVLSALVVPVFALAEEVPTTDPCSQPSPVEMAKEAGVELPRYPWHLANIWWTFKEPVKDFESLSVDVTIDRDVPADYNLYIAPVGVAEINGLMFYGGIQTNINGWADPESRERVHREHGGIFSRWSSDKKTPIGLDHVRVAGPDCLVESAGYEGEFASVRRPLKWSKGTWIYQIRKAETVEVEGQPATWFECRIQSPAGEWHPIGKLRFEGRDFTYWAKHSAFVEVYATQPLPRSPIPKVEVTFGWPQVNGRPAAVTGASAHYPDRGTQAGPDCATIRAEGEAVRVSVGKIFKRDPAKRSHPLRLDPAGG
ncbi:DUF3472 domain-containing protein [Haloferula sp. A504]|uniref:DUF3472 domain-containing protein n=1 Tax=Haloferula sp. A504 TaxID=3373601 RepID=UPI0031C6EDCC|nr:hypothetical protein [Verrucomicrobiaceae bacterium E54]